MFRMIVKDVFFIRGRGVVAAGRIESGQLRVGDQVQLNGEQLARVDGIETSGKVLEEAQAGDDVGVLFGSLDKSQIKRGDAITASS
jgi:elongation factor Tu